MKNLYSFVFILAFIFTAHAQEEKLKKTDEISFHLYMTEKKNIFHSKNKNKREIKDLLTEVIDHVDDNKLFNKIKNQIEKY